MTGRGCWIGVLTLGLVGPAAAADRLDPFVGAYVGRAEETGKGGEPGEQRDIDLVISPSGKGGLSLEWTNVTLVDGRRDVPGVKRKADRLNLTPAPERQLYLATPGYDPFKERSAPEPMAGDPLRWGALEGDMLRVHSFAILEDGSYELQTYTRDLTPEGIALDWRRVVDGKVVRQMTGHAVRAGE